ncbi:hypothetical protein BD560DRAFT_386847, partial [Blakeslea trispora]
MTTMTSSLDDYDVDVVKFWNATLSSYQTCHQTDNLLQDPAQVATDLLKDLPLRSSLETNILDHEITGDSNEASTPAKPDTVQEETNFEQLPSSLPTEQPSEPQLPYDQPTLVQETIEQPVDHTQIHTENSAYPQPDDYHYPQQQQQSYPDPSSFMQPPPIPPPTTHEEAELFSNVIMSWYYAGYYTAMYQAHRQQPP